MPITAPNLYPPFNIVRVAYVRYGVTDLAKTKAFWVDALGLTVSHETKTALYLRALEEHNHHSVIFEVGDKAECRALGFKLFADIDLEKAEKHFKALGHKCEFVTRHKQGKTLKTTDIYGMPLEFFVTMEREPCLMQKYGEHKGGKFLRIDHVNCFTPSVDKSYDFYNNLGFRATEYTVMEDDVNLWAVWMHRKGGVHDVAFTNGVGPRLHHIAFWVATPTNIIDLCDILATTGYLSALERGPGRHGIANAFFLYVLDPDGHRIEIYTSDYLTVDPDLPPKKWALRDAQRQTLWGSPAPKSWFEHGTHFEELAVQEPVMASRPIIAP